MTVKVKPLVWEYHPAGCLGSAGGIGASYIVDTRAKDGSAFFVKGIHPSPSFDTLEAAKAAAQADYEARIIAAIEAPDHPVLVAAAYRDAACVAGDRCAACGVREIAGLVKEHVIRRTPTDAEAHLTAIERAAYERGVQSALQHIRTWMELEAEDRGEADAEYPLERQCAPILALLTQEGR